MAKPQKQKQRRVGTSVKRENFDITEFRPKTTPQQLMVDSYLYGSHIIAHGSAGTGKTFVACHLAMQDIQNREKGKIVIIRSAVPTRDQGFLPGTLEEKSAVFELPYVGIFNEICQSGTAYEIMKKKGLIEFVTTSYLRGITIDNAVVIFDEFQNAIQDEIYTLLTRVGENTQVIMCGDTKQTDLNTKKEQSGFEWLMKVSERMTDYFDAVQFLPCDIVRSEFVKKLIMVAEDL